MPSDVSGHENDIFVSYARVDNTPIRDIDLGWVSHIVATLDIILSQTLGRPDLFALWMDTRRDSPTASLTSDILDHVRQSATLLVILSPGYLASEWCMEELSCFVDTINATPQGSLRRIFVIEKTSFRVERPEVLQHNIVYPLWYTDKDNRIRTRGLPQFHPEETDYYYTRRRL